MVGPVLAALGADLRGAVRDLVPIAVVVSIFQFLVVRTPLPDAGNVLLGAVFVVFGLAFFVRGLQMGLFPIGEVMALGLARRGSLPWLIFFAFALGFTTTIAEPALIAIAGEAAKVAADGGAIEATAAATDGYALGLRITVALSVGVALVIGVVRIIKGWPVHWIIVGGYVVVIVLSPFAPSDILGIAFDSGGVTTSTITVPLSTALGVGLASSIRGRILLRNHVQARFDRAPRHGYPLLRTALRAVRAGPGARDETGQDRRDRELHRHGAQGLGARFVGAGRRV